MYFQATYEITTKRSHGYIAAARIQEFVNDQLSKMLSENELVRGVCERGLCCYFVYLFIIWYLNNLAKGWVEFETSFSGIKCSSPLQASLIDDLPIERRILIEISRRRDTD